LAAVAFVRPAEVLHPAAMAFAPPAAVLVATETAVRCGKPLE